MENSAVNPTVPPRDKNSTITLVLIGVMIILCLGFIVVVMGYISLTNGTDKSNVTNTTNSTSGGNSLVATEPAIKILTPQANSIVNGKISVSGTATYHFNNLKVELIDDQNTKLATGSVSITSASDSINNWKLDLDVINAPLTANGKIVVSSSEPEKQESVVVNFESYSQTPANLVIFTPLKDQVMFSNNIKIRGQAKGLFEGNLQLRLTDSEGNVIYKDSVTIPDQLTTFREFSYDLTVDDLANAKGKTGVWDFYYSSAMDGSEVILQSIPVRFL